MKTALSTALLFGAELLQAQDQCWQKTIDVSGDGENNIGPALEQVFGLAAFNGVTINALVVGDPSSAQTETADTGPSRFELQQYFEREVIRGPGAFSMVAFGYADYARAMHRKMLRELKLPVLGFRASE